MQKKSVVLMAVLWCFSVLFALGVGTAAGWHLALTTMSQTAATLPVKTAPPSAPAPGKTAGQAANDAVAAPDNKPVPDENDRLRVAFRQALKEMVGKRQPAHPGLDQKH